MTEAERDRRSKVLDPMERVSEVMFGLLMALTITGSLSVATAGREEVRAMMAAALGCNLAWGLADAVMYLIHAVTGRTRAANLLAHLRGTTSAAAAHALIVAALPERVGAVASAEVLESLRQRLVASPEAPPPLLQRDDFIGALGVFLLVVLATFPVVIPFALAETTTLALRVSHAISLVMLFACGWLLGRYAGGAAWLAGLAMTAVGVALVAAIMALGG